MKRINESVDNYGHSLIISRNIEKAYMIYKSRIQKEINIKYLLGIIMNQLDITEEDLKEDISFIKDRIKESSII